MTANHRSSLSGSRRDCSLSVAVTLLAVLSFTPLASSQGGDVLVWSTGNSGGQTSGVANYLTASGFFDSVTALDDENAQTLGYLTQFDQLLYFSNASAGQDPAAIGDVLADYADTGRRLVIAVFSWADQGGNTLGGRLITDEITPFILEGGSLYSSVSMISNDGSQLFDDVFRLDGYYHDNVRLTTNAVQHGTWSDSEPLVATKGNVVGVNLFPDDSFGNIAGDYTELFSNCLRGLCLLATDSVSAGDTLTFRTARGTPGAGTVLAAVDVDGVPLFVPVDISSFDTSCERTFSAVTPPGLSGITVTFGAFGFDKAGRIRATNLEVVSFL